MSKALVPFTGRGGGGASTPTTTDDNLRSVDYLEILLGICQGPIKGLVDGEQSFNIGSTALVAPDGTPNFPTLNLAVTNGFTAGEAILPVLGGLQATRGLDPFIGLLYQQIYTIVTAGDTCTEIILGFVITQLYTYGTSAQLQGIPGANAANVFLPGTLKLAINVQDVTGTWQNPFPNGVELSAKTTTGVPTEVTVPVTGTGPYTIAVQMLTQTSPSTSQGLTAYIEWTNWTEVIAGSVGWSRSNTVQQQLFPGVPVVRTSQQPPQRQDGTYGINYLSVRLDITDLILANSSGTFNTTVTIKIEYKQTSLSTWTLLHGNNQMITGKTTSAVDVQQFNFPVPQVDDTWDIRVTQLTAPSGYQTITVSWESFEEIIGGALSFPSVATAHLWGKASQLLTSIPNLWGIYDLQMVKLPGNYNPLTRVYTGTFDGTTPQFDWSNNPAWCLYDLIMNQTFGWASYWSDLNIDIYDIYAAGQWCDVLVPDGAGGLQPRYTMNTVISDPRGAADQIRYMAGVFDGLIIDDLSGTLRLIFDEPGPAVAIFTPENTIDEGAGSFTYTYTDLSVRYNYYTVSFNDPQLNYQTNTRVIWDQDNINEFGKIPLSFAAIGCTDPHEAVRRAAKKLISSTTETQIVAFKTNRVGLAVTPLKFILISDPDMGYGLSGRIQTLSADRTTVFLRDPLYLSVGVDYIFNCHMPNPAYPATVEDPLIIVSIPFVAHNQGANLVILLATPLPAGVDPRSNFSISSVGNAIGVPKLYKIMRIEEQDGNADTIYIEAVEVNPAKQDLSDNAIDRNGLSFVNYGSSLPAPSNVQVSTTIWTTDISSHANMVVTWTPPNDPRVTRYIVEYRFSGDSSWSTSVGTDANPRMDIYDIPSGMYDVQVQAIGIGGLSSSWAVVYNAAAGADLPPDNVVGFTLAFISDHFSMSWLPVQAKNLAYYEIRYTPWITPSLVNWDTAVVVATQVLSTSVTLSAVPGVYLIKAITTAGIYSLNAALYNSAATTIAPFIMERVLQAEAGWPCLAADSSVAAAMYVDSSGKLRLGTGGMRQNTVSNSIYYWESKDYGAVVTCNVALQLNFGVDNISEMVSDWETLDSIPEMNEGSEDQAAIICNIQVSEDGVNFGPFQSPAWANLLTNGGFVNAEYTGRKFLFSFYLYKRSANLDPWVADIAFLLTTTQKSCSDASVIAPTTGITITYPYNFTQPAVVHVSPKNMMSGWYYTVTSETNSGFTVQFFNAAGVGQSVIFDWEAIGF